LLPARRAPARRPEGRASAAKKKRVEEQANRPVRPNHPTHQQPHRHKPKANTKQTQHKKTKNEKRKTEQVHRQFRKPLIVAAPKSLLRHPKCRSPLAEFDDVPDDHVSREGGRGGRAGGGLGFASSLSRRRFVRAAKKRKAGGSKRRGRRVQRTKRDSIPSKRAAHVNNPQPTTTTTTKITNPPKPKPKPKPNQKKPKKTKHTHEQGIVGVRFKRVIMDDSGLSPKSRAFTPPQEPGFKRIVFCSGKVFYELHAERERRRAAPAAAAEAAAAAEGGGGEGSGGGDGDALAKAEAAAAAAAEVAIVRVEQLAPFPFDLVRRELRRYPNAEVLWAQEEPMNMGAFFHVQPRFISSMRAEGRLSSGGASGGSGGGGGGVGGGGGAGAGVAGGEEAALAAEGRIKYAGRAAAASTATGFGEVHAQEQARLVTNALDLAFDGKKAV